MQRRLDVHLPDKDYLWEAVVATQPMTSQTTTARSQSPKLHVDKLTDDAEAQRRGTMLSGKVSHGPTGVNVMGPCVSRRSKVV